MGSELGELKLRAEELASLAEGRLEATRARRLADRLQTGDFLVAVAGEFKRGKSTLVNALVGEPVLPTGVLPLSDKERELLQLLRDRRSPTFFVLDKSDHLGSRDLDDVRQFVVETIAKILRDPIRLFAVEADVQRRGFEDDLTLLARDVTSLRDAVGVRLGDFARIVPPEHVAELGRESEQLPRARLELGLRQVVESAVRASLEQCRSETLAWVDEEWRQLANRFRANVQRRVDSAREAAASLFEVPLPRLEIPELVEQRDRFSFLLLHVGSIADPLSRAASRLTPDRFARRRALSRAQAEMASELDKHAGRARWDIAQRLDDARAELARTMREELEGSVTAVVEATNRARKWQTEDQEIRERQEQLTSRLEGLGSQLAALSGTTA